MRAYIDESGDPGTQGYGSEWLVFGCVMVSDDEAPAAQNAARRALQKVHLGQGESLHFSNLSHDAKHMAIHLFKKAPWRGILLVRNTVNVKSNSPRIRPKFMYQHMAGYVIERMSRKAAELREVVSVYFEESTQLNRSNLTDFRSFIKAKAETGAFSIDPHWVPAEKIYAVPKKEARTLGHEILYIADGLAHAGFKAFELDQRWERREPAYYLELVERLWGRNPLDKVSVYDCGW